MMAKLTEQEHMRLEVERSMSVFKRDDMIQRSRNITLNVQEQRTILYAITKIKPDDDIFQAYTFDIKDFYRMIGWENQSYTEFKELLNGIADKGWDAVINDEGTVSRVRWFSTVHTNKNSGKVTLKFHEDMMPYLLKLVSQDTFYTSYNLKYILPMKSQYSPRLYEILKSYQKNNRMWFFDVDELKCLMDCENYKRWPDFRRFALEPAVEEINRHSDMCVAYDTVKKGKKVIRIEFYMKAKSPERLLETECAIQEELDGQLSMDDIFASQEDSVRAKFFRED